MNTLKLVSAVSLVLFAGLVRAEDPPPVEYTVEIARAQLNLECTISGADGGSAQCTTTSSIRGKQSVDMYARQDQKPGFIGADVIGNETTKNALVLGADADKNLQGIALFRMDASADGKSYDSGMSAVNTTSLAAANLDPLHIEMIDDQTCKVTMTFTAYGPANTENMVTSFNKTQLTDYALEKVRPAIAVARRLQQK